MNDTSYIGNLDDLTYYPIPRIKFKMEYYRTDICITSALEAPPNG